MKKLKLKKGDLLRVKNYLLSLKDEVNKMRIVYNYTPAVFSMLNTGYSIESINSFVKKFSNIRPKDMIGEKCYKIFGNGSICPGCPVERCLRTGKPQANLKEEPSPHGDIQFLYQKAIPIHENGKLVNVLEIVLDATEQKKLEAQLQEDFLNTIEILVSMIELHDRYTGGHSHSVKELSVRIAQEMGLSGNDIEAIEIAALLHDIGKVGIKDYVLNKTGQLSEEEFALIKEHPVTGEEALKKIKRFAVPRMIIRHHHERYDGNGYPDGLSADRIPLGARILAVADAFDAMTSDRAYRKAMDKERALQEIIRCKGSQFDPSVVESFCKCFLDL